MTEIAPRRIAGYGFKPSLGDPRDTPADTSGLKIAAEVDPRDEMMPPYAQLQLGSCTANAVAAAIQYDAILDDADSFGIPSRLAIYWLERFIEGGLSQTWQDTGAFGRDGFKVAQKIGFAPEADWPYVEANFSDDPRTALAADFARLKLVKPYHHVTRNVEHWRKVLSNRQTIAFGFTVFPSFESAEVARTGIVPMPEPGERPIGGHEVLAVGYLRDAPEFVLVRNSWDVTWGLGGYFLMPWDYIMHPARLATDFRTIVRSK